ncbi:MAG: flagellar biosynthesis regulator FlaF [Pseudorhodoplanes sp.]
MQNAAQAYGAVAKQTASPRDLEASLLLQAAFRLQAAQEEWDSERIALDRALTFNRKLWTLFLSSVTRNDNPLPAEIRQNVANIGVFVMNQTLSLITDPAREKLDSLIAINRNLAAGLREGPR